MKTLEEVTVELDAEAKINPERIKEIVNSGIVEYKDNPFIRETFVKMSSSLLIETVLGTAEPEILIFFRLLNALSIGILIGMRMESRSDLDAVFNPKDTK